MQGNRRLQSCDIPVKLWIADISNMRQHHIFTFAYIFKGRFTKSVDIMGTVTSRAEYASFFIYIVDDGTGAIVCKLNKNLKIDEERYEELLLSKRRIAESPMPAHVKQARLSFMEKVMTKADAARELLDLGTTVHIQGKVYERYERRQVFVTDISVIKSLEEEADHILKVCALYKMYDRVESARKAKTLDLVLEISHFPERQHRRAYDPWII
ncbi:CST complex subunit STN1-like isoform X2 [Schistocerca serialis cubense]|uniref:CST complex subunit STN1-like isoform X2 n=1 Tax=Schistocerca serialis cubense TaxID=2023355 RepID=UPI00214EEEFA|nr:CST complex subunit STN1-like isoform X2 [Schistocerca serialis cubense]